MILGLFFLCFCVGLFFDRVVTLLRLRRQHRRGFRPASYRDTNIHNLDVEL